VGISDVLNMIVNRGYSKKVAWIFFGKCSRVLLGVQVKTKHNYSKTTYTSPSDIYHRISAVISTPALIVLINKYEFEK